MSEVELTALVLRAALVLARIVGAVILLPGFGEISVPPVVRAGIAISLTIILFPLVTPDFHTVPKAPFALGALLLSEFAIGLYLGWLVKVIMFALPMAGQIISYQIGLSSIILPNQQLGADSTLLSNAFGLAMPALVFNSSLFALPIMALAHSYSVMPPGQTLYAQDIIRLAVSFSDQEFGLAVRLAAPFLVAGLVWQAGLAVIARLVPQIQIFFVAAPGQILGGLALLSLLCTTLIVVWEHDVMRTILQNLGS
jgi:flagellar biosynthetic protein FliR